MFHTLIHKIIAWLYPDKETVLSLIREKRQHVSHIPKRLLDDQDVVHALLKYYSRNPNIFKYASKRLKNDKELVLIAISKNGCALQYASKYLKDDNDIVMVAITNNSRALKYASSRLQNNKSIILQAIQYDMHAFEYASPELKRDNDIILSAIHLNGLMLAYANIEYKNNKELVLKAVSQNGNAINYIGESLKQDMEIAITAIRYKQSLVNTMDNTLAHCNEIKFMYENNPYIKDTDWPLVKEALLKNPNPLITPPPLIKELTDNSNNKYKLLAEYALNNKLLNNSDNTVEFDLI